MVHTNIRLTNMSIFSWLQWTNPIQEAVQLRRDGKIRDSIKYLEKLVEQSHEDSTAYLNLGISLSEANDYEAAVYNLTNALKYDSNCTEALYHRGVAYLKFLELMKAARDLTEYIGKVKNSADAYFNLGLVKQNSGNLTEAAANMEMALKVDPNHQKAKEHLVIVKNCLAVDI